ncbi:MAG: hypothetical protein ABI977_12175 [Acidobacteriota bacterium]
MKEEKRQVVAKWVNRIKDTFRGPSGISGHRVLLLHDMEKAHAEALIKIRGGYAVILDAFTDFFIQTIEEAYKHSPQPSAFRFGLFIASLQRFRSSYNTFWDGYYNDAAAHLRPLFENLLNYGAMINGFITEKELFEGPQNTNLSGLTFKQQQRSFYKHHSTLSKNVQNMMIGSLSGLSQTDQENLNITIGILHSHVHRAESTQFKIVFDAIKQKPITYLPILDEQVAGNYIFTSIYACWAITRILPFLSQPHLFTDQWQERYKVLDQSFQVWATDEAKDIDEAFMRFMNSRMYFGV